MVVLCTVFPTLRLSFFQIIAKLPSMFFRRYLHKVPSKVTFTDPQKNIVHMSIVKSGNNIYFSDGWKFFCDLYGIQEGGWVHMAYDGRNRFFIRIFNPKGREITYPPMPESLVPDTPSQARLTYSQLSVAETRIPVFNTTPLPIPSKLIDYDKFHTKPVKWVTFAELTGDTMVRCIFYIFVYDLMPITMY